jgi:hypothetical protein
METCWYDGMIQLRKGDIVRITRAYDTEYNGYRWRLGDFDVVTTGTHLTSPFGGKIIDPIEGRVVSSDVIPSMNGVGTTYFKIEEGRFEDHVFVNAGEVKKGQDAIIEIFTRRIDQYVKIWDPYVSIDTLQLLSNVGNSTTILILTEKFTDDDVDVVIKEAKKLSNKVLIKQQPKREHHDRFILTLGEGWSVGHSLKDFGSRTSLLAKLPFSHDPEWAFDDTWIRSKTIL